MVEEYQITRELDVSGLNCPMPLLKAKQALNAMVAGDVLKVLATDPGSERDFVSFANLAGHELLLSEQKSGTFTYILRKHG